MVIETGTFYSDTVRLSNTQFISDLTSCLQNALIYIFPPVPTQVMLKQSPISYHFPVLFFKCPNVSFLYVVPLLCWCPEHTPGPDADAAEPSHLS